MAMLADWILVISEHTEESLSQKDWEEKLLMVRAKQDGH